MRHEPALNLIRLAEYMQSTSEGVSLKDIEEEFSVAVRTAQRMISAVSIMFIDVESFFDDENIKRWRLRASSLPHLQYIKAPQLDDLHSAIEILHANNMQPQADSLQDILTKLQCATTSKRASIETDYDALLEGRSYATRVGPAPVINTKIVEQIKDAILSHTKIKITYEKRHTGKIIERVIRPYGFLYGQRHYLVAYCDKSRQTRNFVLSNITDVQQKNAYFEREDDFDLKTYAEQSFGIFQEQPVDVKWKFPPKRADDVLTYTFHPKQKIKQQKDGSIIVSFTAGGQKEMCWHLLQWENDVEILEPESLKKTYKKMLKGVLKNLQD